ncbi:MAG TPA: dihydrolipoamide acetyltransferase family protein [Actinomycetota bacterium]|nr:dihydrolipoamide acetyltransferase family protein [Actinomycetota bacterium]
MATEVKLPRLGQGMESGTIVRWLKTEGDAVSKGEPLFELDTDKVTQEVEAESDGVLLKIVIADGEVDVGTTVAIIGAQDEDVSELMAAPSGNGDAPAAQPAEEATEGPSDTVSQGEEATEAPEAPDEEAPATEVRGAEAQAQAPEAQAAEERAPRADGEPVKASPLARRIARERGLDLAQIRGTGPEGRVIAEDVEKAAVQPAEPSVAAAEPEFEVVELTKTRKTIARRLTEAWQAPVFQLTVTADATELVATRERMVELMRADATKPTVSDVLTRLVASALVRHRPVNANFVDGQLHRFSAANVGLAVAAPAGLVVPVIRDADRKSVQQIAADRADLVSRARDGKLQLADLEGGTFTISNLGMYGVEQFIAVLNPPQVAILAVGSIEDRPAAIEGEFAIVPTLTMTLTCDHRAIDGSEGAEFLRDVKAFVEQPALAL